MTTVNSLKRFRGHLKKLARRHRSLIKDIDQLITSLELNPTQGVSLGQGCRKIRLKISSKAGGESGGARIVTYYTSEKGVVVLLDIYDKADKTNLTATELSELVALAKELVG